MDKPVIEDGFQVFGAASSANIRNEFKEIAFCIFSYQGARLSRGFAVPVGAGALKKQHKFDLGGEEPPVLIECKPHSWTQGNNIPSAKIRAWNETMYYFHLTPLMYRKIMFVLRDFSIQRNQTLAGYYLRHYGHLIPTTVELWEYDPVSAKAMRIH